MNLIAGVEIAVETLIVSYSHHLLFVTRKEKEIWWSLVSGLSLNLVFKSENN